MSLADPEDLFNKIQLAEATCKAFPMRFVIDWVTKPVPLIELLLHGPVGAPRVDAAVLCMWMRGAALNKKEAGELLYLWTERHKLGLKRFDLENFLDAAYSNVAGQQIVARLLGATRAERIATKDPKLKGLSKSARQLYGAVIDLERKAGYGERLPFETDVATLMQASGLSKQTVVACLKAMQEVDVLRWNPGSRTKRSVIQRV